MKQAKNVMVILYSEPLKDVIEVLRPTKWAYIKHNKDLQDNGELKKEHWHLLLSFETKKSLSLIAKVLNVEENLIECVNNYKSVERYLIHLDNGEKAQYDVNEVIANYDYKTQVYSTTESILSFLIQECEKYDNIRDFNVMIMKLGIDYMKIYKQYYSMIKDVIYYNSKSTQWIREENCKQKDFVSNMSDFDLMQEYKRVLSLDLDDMYSQKVYNECMKRKLIVCRGLTIENEEK